MSMPILSAGILPTGLVAIGLYVFAFARQVLDMRQGRAATGRLLAVSGLAVIAHGITSWALMATSQGVDFGLLPVSVLIFFVINLIVVLSSFRQPLHNLFLLLFPPTVALLAWALIPRRAVHAQVHLSAGIDIHILLSILAYSLLAIAALQAILLAYQHRRLHQHQLGGRLLLPPLQTMEALLFEIVWTGFFLLTLALAVGFMFVDNFLAQHLAHKAIFSVLAWLVYATLLWGHYRLGWRGKRASYWTLGGFATLMLGFWGTKFVLEVILGRP